jgi:hypothetical protein
MPEEIMLNQNVENNNSKLNQEQMQIDVDSQTAFALKIQEFDKNIAEAETKVAQIKLDKAAFVYDCSVQQIVAIHKERIIRAQIEEEAKKLSVAKS